MKRLLEILLTLLVLVVPSETVTDAAATDTNTDMQQSTELEDIADDSEFVIEVEELTEEDLEEMAYYDSLELLAICVEAEAGDQSLLGKRMVVDVVLNRVDDADWPDNIVDVISDPYEFASYWNGGMDSVWEPSEETFLAVQMELEERSYPNIYYFTAGDYGEYGTPYTQVGDHYFSTK